MKRKQSATKDVNYYGPLSPSLHAGGSVLKRMNTIAPGPFGVDRRRTNSKGGSRPGTAMSDRSCGSPPALPISIHSSQPSVADGLSQSPENSQSLPALEKSASQVVDPPTVHISRFNERSNTFPSIDQDSKPDQLIDTHDSDSVAQSFGKPAHFSGESQSSAGSADTSERQTSSSRSTPPLTEFPALMPEGQSMVSDSVDQLMEKLRMRDAALSERRPSKISRDEGMPLTASIIPEIVSPDDLKKQSICDSPVDPHIQPTPRIEDPLVPQLPSTTFVKQLATTPKAPPVPVEESAPLQRRKTTGRRKCRGCDQVIIGKSIASADGRLTGRYHKACFSCKQCKSPFETATFYVHDNHPYCGRHYHELNGSLCKKCDDGIEGQYLETGQAQKFHQGCFTCDDCQKPLQDDYYELGGKALCETHAFRPMHQTSLLGPGRRHPERRTTRLMMMPP